MRLPTPPPESVAPNLPRGDLIVRLALMKKGILTDVDLAEAEFWVRESVLRAQALEVVPDVDNGGMRFQLIPFEDVVQEMKR